MSSNLDRRIRQLYQRACKRSDAIMWRHLKQIEAEIAALAATKLEIQRLQSLKRKPKRKRSR